MGRALSAPGADQIRSALERMGDDIVRTPLVRIDHGAGEVFLKLECLQPIGSFKLRGALNRMRALPRTAFADGVYTASAGNMAQGVAWAARAMGIPASVVVPETAPKAKLDAIERLGGTIVKVPFDEWWTTMQQHGRAGMRGTFVHPFADADVMAGNATIALEILDALPDVDAILVPWGGGGLACGIAAGLKARASDARVYACEVEGAAPLRAALDGGAPRPIDYRRSFIDGIGGRTVFPEMWPLVSELIADSLVATPDEVADALRLIATRARVIAEGAGAAALAALRANISLLSPAPKRVVCIVSGGNIDPSTFASILVGSGV